jgi:transcriptional regulator of acetoin/glycerol metabolism
LRFGRKIELPPLKGRRADIPILTYFFIDQGDTKLRTVSHGAMRMLLEYDWPGNIRELRELIKELSGFGKEIIFSFDLPERMRQEETDEGHNGISTVQEMERREIIKALHMANGNKTRASEILGYRSKQTLYNKIEKYNITPPSRDSLDNE